jgi:DNA polymerase III alpha subunit
MLPHMIEDRFREFPEALQATTEIVNCCRFDFTLGKPQISILPGFKSTSVDHWCNGDGQRTPRTLLTVRESSFHSLI